MNTLTPIQSLPGMSKSPSVSLDTSIKDRIASGMDTPYPTKEGSKAVISPPLPVNDSFETPTPDIESSPILNTSASQAPFDGSINTIDPVDSPGLPHHKAIQRLLGIENPGSPLASPPITAADSIAPPNTDELVEPTTRHPGPEIDPRDFISSDCMSDMDKTSEEVFTPPPAESGSPITPESDYESDYFGDVSRSAVTNDKPMYNDLEDVSSLRSLDTIHPGSDLSLPLDDEGQSDMPSPPISPSGNSIHLDDIDLEVDPSAPAASSRPSSFFLLEVAEDGTASMRMSQLSISSQEADNLVLTT